MASTQDMGNLLETMEEGQDEVPDDKAVRFVRLKGTRIGQLLKRDMESGENNELNPNE